MDMQMKLLRYKIVIDIKKIFPKTYKKIINKPIMASTINYPPIKKTLNEMLEDNPDLNLSQVVLCWRFDEDYGDEWVSLGMFDKNPLLSEDEIIDLDESCFISSDGIDLFTIDQKNDYICFFIYNKPIFKVKNEEEFIRKILNENMYDIFGFSRKEWEDLLK